MARLTFLITVLFFFSAVHAQSTTASAQTMSAVDSWIANATGAANAGNKDSAQALGDFYNSYYLVRAVGSYQDNPYRKQLTALVWYDKARAMGCIKCFGDMASTAISMGYAGNPIPYDTIVYWLEHTEPKNADILRTLGAAYQYGTKNLVKAEENYRRAAAAGDETSKGIVEDFEMSRQDAWAKGEAAQNRDDMPECLKWYRIAALYQNNGKAAYNVGLIYDAGLTGPKNAEKGLQWYIMAGELGNYEGWFEAGQYYFLKWQHEFNDGQANFLYTQAKNYWQKAAALGDPDANRKITVMETQDREYRDWLAEKQRKKQEDVLAASSSNNNYYTPPAKQPRQMSPKACSACNGRGSTHTTFYGGMKDAHGQTVFGETTTCGMCGGKGYVMSY